MSLRVLLVGLGNRSRVWSALIADHPGVMLAGVMDRDGERIAAHRAGHGASPAWTDLSEALRESRPDAVVLVTPPEGHRAQAELVFAAGAALLCEKPLALDLADARAIVEDADARALPLTVGLNFRYLPVSRALRDLVRAETYGPPGSGHFAYWRNRDWWRPGMNTYPLTMRHPMLLEQSIHHLDLIRFCYGREVEAVSCRCWTPAWSAYAHHPNVSCLLSLEGGLEVDYTGTWTGGRNSLDFQWRTDCAEGVIVQRALFGDLAAARADDPVLLPVPLDPCEPFLDDTRALFAAFVTALETGKPPPCGGADHLRTLALCFAAIEADETGRRIDMRAFDARHGIAA